MRKAVHGWLSGWGLGSSANLIAIGSMHLPTYLLLALAGLVFGVLRGRRRWLLPALVLGSAHVVHSWIIIAFLLPPGLGAGVPTGTMLFLRGLDLGVVPIAMLGAWLGSRLRAAPIEPDRCPKCGYSTKLLPSSRCPECGTQFETLA